MQRDILTYDVVIVGAGPAGLAAAIRLKQLAHAAQRDVSVCILEKGEGVGAHILSGAVFDPRALDELIPDWGARGAPLTMPVSEDRFLAFQETDSTFIPRWLLPPLMKNQAHYHVVSLGKLCRWLAGQAENLGVDVLPGFSAVDTLHGEDGRVTGILTGDMGCHKDGSPKPEFTPGAELHANYVLLAEGARGSLTRTLEDRFNLRRDSQAQHYALGLKEVWQIEASKHHAGRVWHTLGWPLKGRAGGGGFVYHQADNQLALGLVVHLDYRNPSLDPFAEFQRFKTHPAIRSLLEGGQRLAFGARTIAEGGLQSLPKLVFPGGALIGCSAGLVNVPRIKGIHNAMKSGMLAAETAFSALLEGRAHDELTAYPSALQQSWVWQELDAVRNSKPAVSRFGTWLGGLYSGLDLWAHSLGLRLPWTLQHGQPDHECLLPAASVEPIVYPQADNVTSFDKPSSVYLANIAHDEDQPCHLQLRQPDLQLGQNLLRFDAPETRYCPAGVYEVLQGETGPRLQINAANCIHCKTCDIKDPQQNIRWVPPEGGSGPNYLDL